MHPPTAVFDDSDAEATVECGGEIVAVAFQRDRELEDPLRRHSQAPQSGAQGDPGDDRRGTATEPTIDRDVVLDPKLEPAYRPASSLEWVLGGSQQHGVAGVG